MQAHCPVSEKGEGLETLCCSDNATEQCHVAWGGRLVLISPHKVGQLGSPSCICRHFVWRQRCNERDLWLAVLGPLT